MSRRADGERRVDAEEQREKQREKNRLRTAATSHEFNELRKLLLMPKEEAQTLSQLDVLKEARHCLQLLTTTNQKYETKYSPYQSPGASPSRANATEQEYGVDDAGRARRSPPPTTTSLTSSFGGLGIGEREFGVHSGNQATTMGNPFSRFNSFGLPSPPHHPPGI